ncbi:hypothetical protein BX661DRAFT_179683 [Kickxella alabastrina]|uniref:uncharacterized protein n=1 Tax=Kickxella alabastrina TaxID=61397 RepID=UPI0022208D69|nr:uncharacterized protein BX661DRAFT_179683 [Kickxella alabastrina]KAI7832028.1 hypothetical protein BX661DRAFT_179683 [Kickxella alabastrina]
MWPIVITWMNRLLIIGIIVIYIVMDILTTTYIVDFEANTQIAKRTVHILWLVFLLALSFKVKVIYTGFATFKDIAGQLRVFGTVYLLIGPAMLADPVLYRIKNGGIETDTLREIYRHKIDQKILGDAYIALGGILLASGYLQLVAGFLYMGKLITA